MIEGMEKVFEHVKGLEESLLKPEVRASVEAVSALLAEDFVEFGTSGRVWDKASTLESLKGEQGSYQLTASDFAFRELSIDVVQITYRTVNKDMKAGTETRSLRSSIWKLFGSEWRMVFHQGTKTS